MGDVFCAALLSDTRSLIPFIPDRSWRGCRQTSGTASCVRATSFCRHRTGSRRRRGDHRWPTLGGRASSSSSWPRYEKVHGRTVVVSVVLFGWELRNEKMWVAIGIRYIQLLPTYARPFFQGSLVVYLTTPRSLLWPSLLCPEHTVLRRLHTTHVLQTQMTPGTTACSKVIYHTIVSHTHTHASLSVFFLLLFSYPTNTGNGKTLVRGGTQVAKGGEIHQQHRRGIVVEGGHSSSQSWISIFYLAACSPSESVLLCVVLVMIRER